MIQLETLTCACGQPVWIKKRGQCKTCYTRLYMRAYRRPEPSTCADCGAVGISQGFTHCAKCRPRKAPAMRPQPPCKVCGQPCTGTRKSYCSDRCSDLWRRRPGAWGKVGGPQRRRGPAYQKAVNEVRARAKAGEPCWFCGGGFNWALHHNQRGGFTVHHLHRVMDGGEHVPDAAQLVPAHRGCNARDGLHAQNQRRAGRRADLRHMQHHQPQAERTSRQW